MKMSRRWLLAHQAHEPIDTGRAWWSWLDRVRVIWKGNGDDTWLSALRWTANTKEPRSDTRTFLLQSAVPTGGVDQTSQRTSCASRTHLSTMRAAIQAAMARARMAKILFVQVCARQICRANDSHLRAVRSLGEQRFSRERRGSATHPGIWRS